MSLPTSTLGPSTSTSSSATADPSASTPSPLISPTEITYSRYASHLEPILLPAIRSLISADLSEPYSIYVYRYFLYQWGDLCFLASHHDSVIGVVIAKLEPHRGGPQLRGYIAMLAVRSQFRGRGIATKLVSMAIDAMKERGADEIALETEVTNTAAMKLYERLGFLRSKKLHRYYLSGNSAYRLILYLKPPHGSALRQGDHGIGCDCGHEYEEEDEHGHDHHHGHKHHHGHEHGIVQGEAEFDEQIYL